MYAHVCVPRLAVGRRQGPAPYLRAMIVYVGAGKKSLLSYEE